MRLNVAQSEQDDRVKVPRGRQDSGGVVLRLKFVGDAQRLPQLVRRDGKPAFA
jgi:hypothetical protein